MMSANEFFDNDPEPSWLVDACGGEVVSPNSDLEFFYRVSSSTAIATYVDLNESTEAGPSNSVMNMDVDDEARPHVPSLNIAHQEFERDVDHFLQDVSLRVETATPSLPIFPEHSNRWQFTPTPIRTPTRKFPLGPASDLFFRASKKRKRSLA